MARLISSRLYILTTNILSSFFAPLMNRTLVRSITLSQIAARRGGSLASPCGAEAPRRVGDAPHDDVRGGSYLISENGSAVMNWLEMRQTSSRSVMPGAV